MAGNVLSITSTKTIKITAFGASNTEAGVQNSNQSYYTFAAPKFGTRVTTVNAAVSGISAATSNSGDFVTYAQPQYDATKDINILTLQFGGGNVGDLTSNPASVTPFYNNLVGIAQKWKALGPRTKVIVFTTWSYGCSDAAMVTNYSDANALIVANSTDFDAVINVQTFAPWCIPTTACPITAIAADCNHITPWAADTYMRGPYVNACNLLF